MSTTTRVPNTLLPRLNEIRGLLMVQRRRNVSMGEVLVWVFQQLPKDYLEKLKEQALYPPGGPD